MRAYADIRKEIPFLRRFGRAMTGEQQLADVCVVALMSQLLDGSGVSNTVRDPKITLYRSLLTILDSHTREIYRRPFDEHFSSRSRQFYWLSIVENFSEEMLAAVYQTTSQYVRAQLAYHHLVAAGESGAVVQIIEDETLIAHDLRRIVKSMGHDVSAISRTRSAAVGAARHHAPDLILSDVQLADGSSGIDAVADIENFAVKPVIFITAFPERLLTGKGREPAFLISKPFDPLVVKATIGQALYLQHDRPTQSCGAISPSPA